MIDRLRATARDLFILLLLLVVLPLLAGCQMVAHHDYRAGEFTHSANFGQGTVDAEEGKIESKGLSIPGMKLAGKVLDAGLGLVSVFAPSFIANAMTSADIPDHVHPPAEPPQPIVVYLSQPPELDPPPWVVNTVFSQ